MTMQFFWAIGAAFLAVLAWAVMPTLGKVIYSKNYINTEKEPFGQVKMVLFLADLLLHQVIFKS